MAHPSRCEVLGSLIAAQGLVFLASLFAYRLFMAPAVEPCSPPAESAWTPPEAVAGGSAAPLLAEKIRADERFAGATHVLAWLIAGELALLIVLGIRRRRAAGRAATRTGAGRPPIRLSVGRKLAFTCILLVLPLAAALPLQHRRHEAYLRGLRDPAGIRDPARREGSYPEVTAEQIVNLGWAHLKGIPVPSSYTVFERRKPPGTIRIGLFGDSFTFGDEVGPGHDVPSLLQGEFDAAGYEHVEVINFGMSAYGEHQAVLMWEYLGRQYDLDYTVFPFSKAANERDATFVFSHESLGPIHARYVLSGDGGEVELIPVDGASPRQAVDPYYGFPAPWRYIRYDRRLAPFLGALWPHGIGPRNPLYYRGSDRTELPRIYVALLRRLAREARNLVVVTQDPATFALRGRVGDGVYFLRTWTQGHVWGHFLCAAPRGHQSGAGNRLRAEELFCLLTGKERPALRVMETSVRGDLPGPGEGFERPLYESAEVFAALGRDPVGFFGTHGAGSGPGFLDKSLDFREDRISALAYIPAPDPIFVPCRFRLADGAPVTVRFELGEEPVDVPIGFVRAGGKGVVGRIVFARAAPGPTVVGGCGWSLEVSKDLHRVLFDGTDRIGNASVWIGGERALEEVGTDPGGGGARAWARRLAGNRREARLEPVAADFAGLRGWAGQFADASKIDDSSGGTIDLVARDGVGRESRCPLLAVRALRKEGPDFDPIYPDPVRRGTF